MGKQVQAKNLAKKKIDPKKTSLEETTPTGAYLDKVFGFLSPLKTYLKGAWYELTQVRWPNRRATWSLTLAVIGFSAFFGVIILLLDVLFEYLFKLMIG